MHRLVKSIVNWLEEEFYPPEDMIRKEFIDEVEEAENRINEGKCKTYSFEEFKKRF